MRESNDVKVGLARSNKAGRKDAPGGFLLYHGIEFILLTQL